MSAQRLVKCESEHVNKMRNSEGYAFVLRVCITTRVKSEELQAGTSKKVEKRAMWAICEIEIRSHCEGYVLFEESASLES